MVSVKTHTQGCPKCCCADCSERPSEEARLCCMCVCGQLTASLVTTDAGSGSPLDPPGPCDANCNCASPPSSFCSCISTDGDLAWDPARCAWVGSVSCASLIVDLEVAIKRCDETCYICVKSTCLNLSGDCGTGTASCWTITTCGEYKSGCVGRGTGTGDQVLSAVVIEDFSGCGDSACGSATLTIKCTDYVNPQPDPPICCDCDCMCECVCITYEQGGCSEVVSTCWDGSRFTAAFSGDCEWSQSATITLVNVGGNCYWRLSVTNGTPDVEDVPAGCPNLNATWEISDTGTGTLSGTLTMVCGVCSDGGACCDRNLPTELSANICTECGNQCAPLNLVSSTSEETLWRTPTVTLECPDEAVGSRPCESYTAYFEFACILVGEQTVWEIRFYCGGSLKDTATPNVQCEPLCATGSLGPPDIDCISTVCGDSVGVCVSEAQCA